MAEQEVQKTIAFYEKLSSQYPTPESWANNIQESLKFLTSETAHTNFYSYLFNPETYVFQKNIKCCTEEDEVKYNKMMLEFEQQSLQTTKVYKNGRDAKIFYYPNKTEENGEKSLDHLSVPISQITQINEHEASNEIRSGRMEEKEEKIDS